MADLLVPRRDERAVDDNDRFEQRILAFFEQIKLQLEDIQETLDDHETRITALEP